MAVGAKAQQLQIRAAKAVDDGIVPGALPFRVGVHAVGNVAVILIDVHMVKEVMPHEVGVALVMILWKSNILVQIHGLDLRKIQIAGLIFRDQLLIGADGAAAGSQAKHAIRLQLNLGRDDVRRLTAHILIILCNDQSHGMVLLSF